MNINDAFPSRYLAAETDIPAESDLIVTIQGVEIEVIGQGEKSESKPVLYFNETKKGLTCNKTNGKTLAGLFGPETDRWVGHRIALFSTEVDYQGRQVLAIRVRMKVPPAQKSDELMDDSLAGDLLSKEQALAAVASIGLAASDLAQILPKDPDGKVRYNPARDTARVRELVLEHTPPAEEIPF